MPRPVRIALACLLLASFAYPQRSNKIDLRAKVFYSNSRSVRNHTQVDLLNGIGTLLMQRFTDETGNVEFRALDPGNYRLRVSDPMVEENMTDVITLLAAENMSMQMVTVKLKKEAEAVERQLQAKESLVSALELNVPSGARKEFEKGARALEEDKLPEAQKRFERAIELYPQYAMAYNHLGVVYMLTGAAAKGREAFEKAVALNDRYPSALLNLAKLRYQDGKMQEVEALLRRAVSGDPSNTEMLYILCNAQLQNGRMDDALANTMKLHRLPHPQYAGVHYLTAQALEAKERVNDAIGQYTIFLQEAPQGAPANRARMALGRLRARAASQSVSQSTLQR